ncbi:MAG: holo-ACP synthase [Fidelibacterota bacterium]
MSIGTDIVSVQRIANLLAEKNHQFKQKVFTPVEIEYCDRKPVPAIHYAGRFAAKEAIKKALLSSNRKTNVAFNKLEITNAENGAPVVQILSEKVGNIDLRLSISHTEEFAVAFAIALEPCTC